MADSYGTLLFAVLTDKVCEGVPDRVFSFFRDAGPVPVNWCLFPGTPRLLHRHLTQCTFLYPAEQPAFPTQGGQAIRDERSPAAARSRERRKMFSSQASGPGSLPEMRKGAPGPVPGAEWKDTAPPS